MGPRVILVIGSACALVAAVVAGQAPAAAVPRAPGGAPAVAGAILSGRLPSGQTATVSRDDIVAITSRDDSTTTYQPLPASLRGLSAATLAQHQKAVLGELAQPVVPPFRPGDAIVALDTSARMRSATVTVTPATLRAMRAGRAGSAPSYTTNPQTNAALARLGTDQVRPALGSAPAGRLAALSRGSGINLASVYQIHITDATVPAAVRALARTPGVAFAEPAWSVTTMQAPTTPFSTYDLGQLSRSAAALAAARPDLAEPGLPSNFGLSSSFQAQLDAPGDDVAAAFDEISRASGQLPGQGEIITDVSIGDLDDSSALSSSSDPCSAYVGFYGPTTDVIGGQRYLNLPAMPLIPTYTADASGALNGLGEVCGTSDPQDSEIGLDFAMMAPLPDADQRPAEPGSGGTDLLGIAPGASYRLVVPAAAEPTNADIAAALLGAGQQQPRPDVITTSLGFGFDAYGFPSRYLEEDPLIHAVVYALVHSLGIVVTIAANDGTRTSTNAAIGPSGGSAPTQTVPAPAMQTTLDDIGYSTAPSRVTDTGAIDVGGTTTDDIFSADPYSGPLSDQQAFPETRWNGATDFSSGYGSRVDISAPSDNIVGLLHNLGAGYDGVVPVDTGGTSAAAPQVAAAAADALQVARLTGHPFGSPVAVRSFLERTATPVPAVPQADSGVSVGPQLDVRRAVETLLAQAGQAVTPGVAGVAVAQRQSGFDNLYFGGLDNEFETDTNPADIDLQGPADPVTGANSDEDALAPITIAPNWEGLPAGTTYRLVPSGQPGPVLDSHAWARLEPAQILAAVGQPLASADSRTVSLTYQALDGHSGHVLASVPVSLTFGPAGATSELVPAPRAPAVVTGPAIAVSYDFSRFPAGLASHPELVVSLPGRVNPDTGTIFTARYTTPLTTDTGTVTVPVSALDGAGIYGIAIRLAPASGSSAARYSDFAYVRVAAPSDARPDAPLLGPATAVPAAHALEIAYDASFGVSYDVSGVPGATGAVVEISAPGPTFEGLADMFSNPNGSRIDDDGTDSASYFHREFSGTRRTVTLAAAAAGLVAAHQQTVRVLPVNARGQVVGEASDVSTIERDGIVPADGGQVRDGFGLDSAAGGGLLTSNQATASGSILSSLETFDPATGAIRQTLTTQSGSSYLTMFGTGVYGSDLGVYGTQQASNEAAYTFGTVPDVARATAVGPAWTPPAFPSSDTVIDDSGQNAPGSSDAFLLYDISQFASNTPFNAFSYDFATGTASPVTNISGPVQSFGFPVFHGFDWNPATSEAYMPVDDLFADCATTPTTIVTADLATGSVGSFQAGGQGGAEDFVLDPGTGIAAMDSQCQANAPELHLINLATHADTVVQIGGSGDTPALLAVDPVHKLFLVEQLLSPDSATNNDALSSVVVVSETGQVLERLEEFSFFTVDNDTHYFVLDPATRTGYAFGPDWQQIQPFGY